jgi:hypothetical protein
VSEAIDYFGNVIEEGDIIVYAAGGRTPTMSHGKVVGIRIVQHQWQPNEKVCKLTIRRFGTYAYGRRQTEVNQRAVTIDQPSRCINLTKYKNI